MIEAVATEPVVTEEVTEQDDIADVAETAEDAVAEQAKQWITIWNSSLLRSTQQQPTPQFWFKHVWEKAPISISSRIWTVPNPAAVGSADKPLFNLILPIVAIAPVIFAVLAWFVGPAWPSSSWQSSQLRWQLFHLSLALNQARNCFQSSCK